MREDKPVRDLSYYEKQEDTVSEHVLTNMLKVLEDIKASLKTQENMPVKETVDATVEYVKPYWEELTRPSVLFKPKIYKHGDGFLAYYEGYYTVTGSTPDEAMRNFDKKWLTSEQPENPEEN